MKQTKNIFFSKFFFLMPTLGPKLGGGPSQTKNLKFCKNGQNMAKNCKIFKKKSQNPRKIYFLGLKSTVFLYSALTWASSNITRVRISKFVLNSEILTWFTTFEKKIPKFWSKTAKTPQNGPKYHFFFKTGTFGNKKINSTQKK